MMVWPCATWTETGGAIVLRPTKKPPPKRRTAAPLIIAIDGVVTLEPGMKGIFQYEYPHDADYDNASTASAHSMA